MLSLKLLVVEDDLASLELMTEVLRSLEAEVRPLSDSQAAAVLVNQEKFDGIFLDLEMPNLNGFALAQEVRTSSWNRLTPIVIVTGRDERETMHQAFATGATFFLQKPIDKRKLAILFRAVRGTMVENRRRYARVPLQTEVTCKVGSKIGQGRTWNLSQGGIQVEAGHLSPGDKVRVSFRLPSSGVVIDGQGTVKWGNETRQGIEFGKLTNEAHEAIRQFISQVENP
ncbi:MAG TPA: response regulator [Terriglobales bacterium]|jgi:CheY-like chemotaxis protein|nr:response regulator [Terriglobales bacterium]